MAGLGVCSIRSAPLIVNISRQDRTLSVTGLRQLNSTTAQAFHSAIATALSHDLQTIEIDLSQTQTVDGAGLGALVALYETATARRKTDGLRLRLTNPSPPVQQMIELARLHHLFEIAPLADNPDGTRAQ
jgi:anti-anti-sigma factor